MLSRVRNEGRDIEAELLAKRGKQAEFCLISYPWLFTTESKQRILKEHFKVEQKLNFNMYQMSEIWTASAARRPVYNSFIC